MAKSEEWNQWLKHIRTSCKLRRLAYLHDDFEGWNCTEPAKSCSCKYAAGELQRKWIAEMKRSITPRLIECMPPFASGSIDSASSTSEQGCFRIMDLPFELRQVIWSYTEVTWCVPLTGSLAMRRITGAPWPLCVSRGMCDELSPFVVLTLVINRRSNGPSSPDVDFPLYWRQLETWLASSPHCIVNQLKRLRLKLVTNYGAHLYFTFAISPKGGLMLDECRFPSTGGGEGGWLPNKPVEAAVVAALKKRVQKVMIQKAAKSICGLRLFKVIIASTAIWQKLLDDNRTGMTGIVAGYLKNASRNATSEGDVDPITVYWRWKSSLMAEVS